MRNHTLNIRLAAVLVAPLLLACGADGTSGSMYVTVPDCPGPGVLTTNSVTGQLECVQLPAGAISLPDCLPNTEALTADGSQPSCTNLNAVDATTTTLLQTLTDIEKKLTDYGTAIVNLGSGPASQPSYVGLSSAMTNGRFTFTDANNKTSYGIAAATGQCVKDYGAGAHMCTVYELYYSASLQIKMDQNAVIDPGGWAYMQSWRYNNTNPVEATAGLADNCGGYTTGTDTNLWQGTNFKWAAGASCTLVPRFFANTPCSSSLPITCCR